MVVYGPEYKNQLNEAFQVGAKVLRMLQHVDDLYASIKQLKQKYRQRNLQLDFNQLEEMAIAQDEQVRNLVKDNHFYAHAIAGLELARNDFPTAGRLADKIYELMPSLQLDSQEARAVYRQNQL